MAKGNTGKHITSQKAYVSLVKDGKSSMHLLRQGATLVYDDQKGGFVIDKPSDEDEKILVISEKTFNSLKENKVIVSAAVKVAIGSTKGSNNVQLEQKVIELMTVNQDLTEQVEDLTEKLEQANETIRVLTAAQQEDDLDEDDLDEDDLDEDDADEDSDESGEDITPPENFVLEENK